MRRRAASLALIGALLVGLWVLWMVDRDGAEAATLTAYTAGYAVRLTVEPTVIGRQEILVEIRDGDGRPAAAEEVMLVPVMAEMGHSLPALRGEAEAPGRWRASGELFSMAGEWEVDVGFRAGGRAETARFSVAVEGA